MDDPTLLTTNNKQISDDLIEFLKSFFSTHEALKKAPFYIVSESYGGKYASELGVGVYKALADGSLDFNFQGESIPLVSDSNDVWCKSTSL